MANPARLVRTISETTGVSLATVIDIDRKLVAAGLRTKGGRGLSAARMSALDAARIVTAILAGPQANQSAEAVTRYANTKVDLKRSSEGSYTAAGLDDLALLAPGHSFVEAIAALIGSAAVGSLRKLIATATEEARPHIEVFAFTRATYGRIRIFALQGGHSASVEYMPTNFAKRRKKTGLIPDTTPDPDGDLEQSRRLTERTILAISELLAEESDCERTRT